jgi:hypothetical protein
VGLGFELRALSLQSRHSTAWATPPVHFALVILKMGSCELFPPGWPQITILLISASQVAKIAGRSHWHLAPHSLLHSSLWAKSREPQVKDESTISTFFTVGKILLTRELFQECRLVLEIKSEVVHFQSI